MVDDSEQDLKPLTELPISKQALEPRPQIEA